MVQPRRCLFCGQPGASVEHVFANWLAEVFGPETGGFALTRQHGRTKTNRAVLGLTSRAACRRCNNEWMSGFETTVRPLLTSAIRGNPTRWVSPDDQRIVARWAFKTALMSDRTNRPKYWTAPNEHFEYLFQHREPPDSVTIHLTRYVPSAGESDFLAWVGSSWAFLGRHGWPKYKAYRITFNVGQAVFQVFGHMAPYNEVLTFEPRILLPDGTPRTDLFRRIWPRVPGPHEWPPTGGHFDTSGLHLLGLGTA